LAIINEVVSFDAALNLLWLLVCLGAVVYQTVLEQRLGKRRDGRARSRRTLSVIMAAIALFPCISATDDVVAMWCLNGSVAGDEKAGLVSEHGTPLKPAANLVRLLELIDHFQISVAFYILLILCLITLLVAHQRPPLVWCIRSSSGRSPPYTSFPFLSA